MAVGLVLLLHFNPSFRDLGVPVGLLVFGLFALLAEVVGFPHTAATPIPARSSPRVEGEGSASPILVREVEGQANPAIEGYQRFLRLSDAPGVFTKVERLSIESPRLVGRVVLVSLFIGRDGREWNDDEVAQGLEAIERSARWIEHEAGRYGVGVRIGLAQTYFQVRDDEEDLVEVSFADEAEDVGPMEARATAKAISAMSRAAAQLGFADAVDLIGRIGSKIDADSTAWLIHFRRSGRSITIPSAESDIDGVGIAVCYSKESSFPEPLTGAGRIDPTTVAHELLHLYGSSDKYGVALGSFPKGSVTSKDVMRLNHARLFRMTIDPLTAQELGWIGNTGTEDL